MADSVEHPGPGRRIGAAVDGGDPAHARIPYPAAPSTDRTESGAVVGHIGGERLADSPVAMTLTCGRSRSVELPLIRIRWLEGSDR
jgi:hypothetical protein